VATPVAAVPPLNGVGAEKGSYHSFVHQISFICPFPSVKLGTDTFPAAHVQLVRNLLNRQDRFLSQSRRQSQFVRQEGQPMYLHYFVHSFMPFLA
jgi:hypothetical protein